MKHTVDVDYIRNVLVVNPMARILLNNQNTSILEELTEMKLFYESSHFLLLF